MKGQRAPGYPSGIVRKTAYAALDSARKEFRGLVARLDSELPFLSGLQEELRAELGYGDYKVETPVVYNRALDGIGQRDRIAFILVADNPGKKEQLSANNRYLVGQSGKLAEGFFNQKLGVDFRREVLILNKTPIHTPKTAELRRLLALGDELGKDEGETLRQAFAASQARMAGLARELHGKLGPETPLWISGASELGPRGLFRPYAEALAAAYSGAPKRLIGSIWLFNHFSMNQFAIEVKKKADPGKPLMEELARIGAENRERILGW